MEPKICIAPILCTGKFAWIDIDDADTATEEIAAFRSKHTGYEEWFIVDHEDFPLGECSIPDALEFAEEFDRLDDQWKDVNIIGAALECTTIDELGRYLEDACIGFADSAEEWMEDFTRECLGVEIPDAISYHIDWKSMVREYEHDGCRFIETKSGGVCVLQNI
jgi:hypothetical protein